MRRELGSIRTTLALSALGIAFDYSFHGQAFGASTPLFFMLLVAALFVPLRDARSRIVLGAAGLVSIFPAILASPALATVNVLAVASLLGMATAYNAAELFHLSVREIARATFRLTRAAFFAPRFLAQPLAPLARAFRIDRARPWLRTIAVTVPIVAIFALLLGSADQVFAEVITPPLPSWNISSIAGHVVLALTGTFLTGVLWVGASDSNGGSPMRLPAFAAALPRMRAQQWTTVAGSVFALFAIFVVVQFAFLFGGRHRVQVTPGLTYAEYARSGFFQLIAVAILTVFLVVMLWDVGERTGGRRFRMLAGGIIGLSFVILLSALTRLRLYEQTFGFTINQFFAYVFIAWIATVFLALLNCLLSGARNRLMTIALATGVVALLGANLVNPERFVAARNVERWRATGNLDTSYLGFDLGPDAIPVTVALLPHLPSQDAARLRAALCSQRPALGPEPSWRSANLARAQAKRSLEHAGITLQRCR